MRRRQRSVLGHGLSQFNFIFSGDLREDALRVCHYIDEFYATLGAPTAEIDLAKVMGVVSGLAQDFPSPLGISNSSPFKKAAAFTASFSAARPILTPLPEPIFHELHTHQNSIIAIELSIDALEGAQLHKENGTLEILKNRIKMSKHFWKDFVGATSVCVPIHHFECLSLIYESLAYQENSTASYPRT